MLSSRPTTGKLRVARNLLPMRDGSVCVRPGARQLVAGSVEQVVPWGNRLLLHQAGRLMLWDGALQDLGPAGPILAGAPYQALTDLGAREDRLYLGDGVRPLRYVVAQDDAYVVREVTNTCLDPLTLAPVEVPVPIALASWNGRLWLSTGSNFVQHCENDDPSYWNPLWTIDCQGADQARVLALRPADDALLVGLSGSLWAVTGKSQYDFQRRAISDGGVAGTHCLAADGAASWWMGPLGVWTAGAAQPISAPIQDWFLEGVEGSLVMDRPRRRLLACVNGRGFACDPTAGGWTEFTPQSVYGVWASEARAGWFGPDGIWAFGSESEPWTHPTGMAALGDDGTCDLSLDGAALEVVAQAETWPEIPNKTGRGRALLVRGHVEFLAAAQTRARYDLVVDGAARWGEDFALGRDAPTWGALGDAAAVVADWRAVLHELVPRVDGRAFVHRWSLAGRAQLLAYSFQYRGANGG